MLEAYRTGLALRDLAATLGCLFIVNDRCDLALAVEADGVHLGQDDVPLAVARRLMGPNRLIGISTHRPEQVTQATVEGADYLGYGPIFGTSTKSDHEPVVGVAGLHAIRGLTLLPVFAIGGITLETVDRIKAAGADGVAVISAVVGAPDVKQAAESFVRGWSA
jgi:thiamine-phosphate pyrophosphorylase